MEELEEVEEAGSRVEEDATAGRGIWLLWWAEMEWGAESGRGAETVWGAGMGCIDYIYYQFTSYKQEFEYVV